MKILVLNGPNLSALGIREPCYYGTDTLEDILRRVKERGKALGVEVDTFQSDVEGDLVSCIIKTHNKIDGIIFNPAAYTHTSIALRDALQSVRTPCIEVHLSNTAAREEYRQFSFTAGACLGQIMGLGAKGYELALIALVEHLSASGSIKNKG